MVALRVVDAAQQQKKEKEKNGIGCGSGDLVGCGSDIGGVRRGRLWVGTMNKDWRDPSAPKGKLYCMGPDMKLETKCVFVVFFERCTC